MEKGKSPKTAHGYIYRQFTKNDVSHRKVLDFVQSKMNKDQNSSEKYTILFTQ